MRAALVLLCAAPLAAALDVPPKARVVDQAGLLAPGTILELEKRLFDYETRTGHQFTVLAIRSLEGESLEGYSLRVSEAWQLGHAGRDDGLLLLISVGDRKARVEVGHGLEGAVTDALSSRVIRSTLGPALAAGDADAGVREALELLMRAAEGESVGRRESSRLPLALFVLLWIAFLILAVQLDRSRRRALEDHHRRGPRRRRRDHVWIEPNGWGGGFGGAGRSHGGFGGGGFGGGGFGGGFGTGGGSFGGGGASGSW